MKIWISHDCDILDMTFFYPNWQLFNECVYSLFRLLVYNLTQQILHFAMMWHLKSCLCNWRQLTRCLPKFYIWVTSTSATSWIANILFLSSSIFHLQKRPLLTEGNHTLNNYNIDRYFEINTIILFSYYLKLRNEPYLTVGQFFNFLKYNIGRILIRL